MKIFSHRGWSAGVGENTLQAFKKSIEFGVDGIEFDVRLSSTGQLVIISHNQTNDSDTLSLDSALVYLKQFDIEILVELKEYSDEFYSLVVENIRKHDLVNRTTVFAFPKEAEFFPWNDKRDVKLGIIAPYPNDIKKYIEAYNPDMILLGWGDKKERLKFGIVWRVLSLPRVFAKYPMVKFIIGVAYSENDESWLSKQVGPYGGIADLPLIR